MKTTITGDTNIISSGFIHQSKVGLHAFINLWSRQHELCCTGTDGTSFTASYSDPTGDRVAEIRFDDLPVDIDGCRYYNGRCKDQDEFLFIPHEDLK